MTTKGRDMNKNNEFNLFEVLSILAKAFSNAIEESKKEHVNEGKDEESFDILLKHVRPIDLKANEEEKKEEKQEPLNTAEQPEEDEEDSVIFGLNLSMPLMDYLKENEKAFSLFEENTGKQPFCGGKCCGDDQNDEDEGEDGNDDHSEDGFDGRVISNETIRDVVDRIEGIEAKLLFGILLDKKLCLEASEDLLKLRDMFKEML